MKTTFFVRLLATTASHVLSCMNAVVAKAPAVIITIVEFSAPVHDKTTVCVHLRSALAVARRGCWNTSLVQIWPESEWVTLHIGLWPLIALVGDAAEPFVTISSAKTFWKQSLAWILQVPIALALLLAAVHNNICRQGKRLEPFKQIVRCRWVLRVRLIRTLLDLTRYYIKLNSRFVATGPQASIALFIWRTRPRERRIVKDWDASKRVLMASHNV